MTINRRDLLAGSALWVLGDTLSPASTVSGGLPWKPSSGSPPSVERPGPYRFFNPQEVLCMEAIADRIIPADAETPGGKDAGCVVFIDRQLAGPYGGASGLYLEGPFLKGEKSQGKQSDKIPGQIYRTALASFNTMVQSHENQAFADLASEHQDEILRSVEEGAVALEGVDGKEFFTLLLKDMQEGFFSDPVYGGNKDMCAWKMIGYPGAHYDYRDWVSRHNERYPYPPVGIAGRPGWDPDKR